MPVYFLNIHTQKICQHSSLWRNHRTNALAAQTASKCGMKQIAAHQYPHASGTSLETDVMIGVEMTGTRIAIADTEADHRAILEVAGTEVETEEAGTESVIIGTVETIATAREVEEAGRREAVGEMEREVDEEMREEIEIVNEVRSFSKA